MFMPIVVQVKDMTHCIFFSKNLSNSLLIHEMLRSISLHLSVHDLEV